MDRTERTPTVSHAATVAGNGAGSEVRPPSWNRTGRERAGAGEGPSRRSYGVIAATVKAGIAVVVLGLFVFAAKHTVTAPPDPRASESATAAAADHRPAEPVYLPTRRK